MAAVRPSRRGLYWPYLLLAVLALAWSGGWLVARGVVERSVDAWLATESGEGRVWTCPDRRIAGFPFRIDLSCNGPTLQRADGVTGSLGGFRSTAQVYAPNHIVTEFMGPLVLKGTGPAELELGWQTARASLRRKENLLARGSLVVEMPRFTVRTPQFEPIVSGGDRLEAHLRETEPAEPGRYDVALQLLASTFPLLDRVTRNQDKLDVLIDLSTRNLAEVTRGDWRRTLEAWRGNGGLLKVETINLSKGTLKLAGKGDLSLDDERRLAGRLDVEIEGAEPLMQAFGLAPRGPLAGLLGGLLGGAGKPLRLPLVLENGRAQMGPFPLGPLRPLYEL